MKQEPDENVIIYGQRVRDLVADAFAESNPIAIEEIMCETFVRGLTTNLRIAVMKKGSHSNFQGSATNCRKRKSSS